MQVGQAKRIGVLGGTFDPIHNGHLVAASEVAYALSLAEVIFVPTGQPWQKEDRDLAPAEDRYLMTVIATASDPLMSVSRVDVDRSGETYTVDTLTDLRAARGPDAEFFFIMGADALAGIKSWRNTDNLLSMAHFVGCTRPGHPVDVDSLKEDFKGDFTLIEIPAVEISSTACRERVRTGRPIRYLVPDGVIQYIAKRGLYRE
jgi:nicotinate-nucleotide adenylyltransferase